MERLPLGTYQAGESLLHQLDPRLKMLLCGLLVMLAFAATDARHLVLILGTTVLVISCSRFGYAPMLRLLWPFRWLFLFTFLLHLCLTPGYTLLGTVWLSRDGLIRGLQVCLQVSVALIVSSLLAMTTRPEALARALGWFFQPLARLGVPIRAWEGLVLLTLRFIPILRERVSALSEQAGLPEATPGFRQRWLTLAVWEARLEILVEELVAQADRMALRILSGKESLETERLSPFLAFSAVDLAAAVFGLMLVLSYLLIGGL